MSRHATTAALAAIAAGEHGDPFAVLGMHPDDSGAGVVVRTFKPQADRVDLMDADDATTVCELERLDGAGVFVGTLPDRKPFPYRFRVARNGTAWEEDDPYRFPPLLGDLDVHLLVQGNHLRSYEKLGAHVREIDGVRGVAFAVWAPSARRVSVVGSFNDWDGRVHPMRYRHACGVWELFVPAARAGDLYKYDIRGPGDEPVPQKADPYGFYAEQPPATASVVFDMADLPPLRREPIPAGLDAPVSIYEVHLGSWRRRVDEGGRYLTYDELGDELIPYVRDLGFTHMELLPISEYPFDGSWGYQPVGLYAPSSRFGSPADFARFVARCHEAGIGVIADWVSGHFPGDAHGLGYFDGTHLYEHADPRQGRHRDWDTLIYNYGRREVTNFLISNALFWLDRYGLDGLRVDAVASMLYLDYSRTADDWIPNRYGGRENLEAIDFLRRMNEAVGARSDSAVTIAEESTAWPMVSRPTPLGGLGFTYKWNMGWMHDTLLYMSKDPIHRKYHHNSLTFGLLYAFTENFVLPLSHDEVVHGKRSLIGRMPGDRWQRFANLRAYFAFMFTMPGKKLLFMGGEFAQEKEWNHQVGLDWQLLDDPMHAGVHALVRDLNRLYRDVPALHQLDCDVAGFQWIDCDDVENSVISYLRRGRDGSTFAIAVCNFTPNVRENYRIGVPCGGHYREVLNSDAACYGGSNVGNAGGLSADPVPSHGRPCSLALTLPPLGVVVLVAENAG